MIRDNTNEIVKQADAAMKEAAKAVVQRARQHGSPIVLWRDGKVVELDPFLPEFDDHQDDPPLAQDE